MTPKPCNAQVDERGRELVEHGTTAFPIACYCDDLRRSEVYWHWHEELEAAVVTEGSVIAAVGKRKFTIHEGEGFFINSQTLHSCCHPKCPASSFHSVVFHPRLVGGSLDSVFYQQYVQPVMDASSLAGLHLKPSIPWQAEALGVIEAAWQACAGGAPGFEFKVRGCLSELTLLLRSNLPAADAPPSQKALRDGQRIKLMLQYIQDHCADELNMALIARSAAVSESECLRCFRSTIGTTPIQYVRQYRIQRAAHLLSTTHQLISDIAAQCGFQDVSYFAKTFREVKGCSPTAYAGRKTQQ